MNGNFKANELFVSPIYRAINISPRTGTIWAWREYNFQQKAAQSLTLLLSKQHCISFPKANHDGYWNNEKLDLKKTAHEKTYLWAFFSGASQGNCRKTENYICNAKALPPWHLLLATTDHGAVKVQFQLRALRKYLPSGLSEFELVWTSALFSRAMRNIVRLRRHFRHLRWDLFMSYLWQGLTSGAIESKRQQAVFPDK